MLHDRGRLFTQGFISCAYHVPYYIIMLLRHLLPISGSTRLLHAAIEKVNIGCHLKGRTCHYTSLAFYPVGVVISANMINPHKPRQVCLESNCHCINISVK